MMGLKSNMRFRIQFQRRSDLVTLLTMTFLVLGFLGFLLWSHQQAAASTPDAPQAATLGLRRYYLTSYSQSTYQGDQAKTACATGYHMASLWEILDPSNLQYDSQLGETQDDSGGGPPSQEVTGWVRTGYTSMGSGWNVPGQSNCNNWIENSISFFGTVAKLPSGWEDVADADVNVWDVGATTCNSSIGVWCVSYVEHYWRFLPIVKQ